MLRCSWHKVHYATMYGDVREFLILPSICYCWAPRDGAQAVSVAWGRWRLAFYLEG